MNIIVAIVVETPMIHSVFSLKKDFSKLMCDSLNGIMPNYQSTRFMTRSCKGFQSLKIEGTLWIDDHFLKMTYTSRTTISLKCKRLDTT